MLEIEQKFADVDFAALRERLRTMGATQPSGVHEEIDHYFNAPDRDFVRTGEAFRLRQIGPANFYTYKGPKQPGDIKIRPELEIALPDGPLAAEQHRDLLGRLGFRFVATVRKQRVSYPLRVEDLSAAVCLDDVDGLGRYAEVELLAPPEQAEQAAGVLRRLVERLGLTRLEPRSYLTALLERQARRGESAREPVVVSTIQDLRRHLAEARRKHGTIGFVPTMGALHEGHASLLRMARARNEFLVASVFVNPTQFGPREDLSRYPRPFNEDVALCATCGVDLIFHPSPEEIYPPGFQTFVEVTELGSVLEGAARPGHFRGVATVVLKLLLLVQPTRAYFGQKDAQQVAVIQRMVADLAVPVEIVVGATVRESDGLALSSRNRYLDDIQRRRATALHDALQAGRRLHAGGVLDAARLRQAMSQLLGTVPGAEVDYAEVVDPRTFHPLDALDRPALLALAVRFGSTRLIDNLPLS